MQGAPRCGLSFMLALVALCTVPQRGRAGGLAVIPDYATVGRVVARVVDGRIVVVVPVAGRLRPRLSEPMRVGNRWRLDLTIEDARLSIGGPKRKVDGVESLTVMDAGADVRITITVSQLGDYGARPSEEGVLFWIDSERPAPTASATSMTDPITTRSALAAREARTSALSVEEHSDSGLGFVLLAALAAGTGLAIRRVRTHGTPEWLARISTNLTPMVKAKLFGAEPQTSRGDEPGPGSRVPPRVPFQNRSSDPRGRSAEIDDAFRVDPGKPASGIAALVATNDTDAE